MKVVVFAHVPPPHHGQSQMVKLMVDGFRADPGLGIEVLHVDARLSEDMADVGSARGGKLRALLGYCRQAWSLSRKHGCRTLYYIPAPPRRTPLYRDFVVLSLLRLRFRRIVFHWHSVGLGAWLETEARFWERWFARRLLGGADVSIVLATTNREDAAKLDPKRLRVVNNGIPDPCPDFHTEIAPHRRQLPERDVVRVLYLAHCTREKGLFDAVEAVVEANRRSKGVRFVLRVAGAFLSAAEEQEFRDRIARPDASGCVKHVGFAAGPAKDRLFRESDLFLFPTYFSNEGQPLNLIEAMAYGLPCVTTRWRAIPEYFPKDYPGLCKPKEVAGIATALGRMAGAGGSESLRQAFEKRYAVKPHLKNLSIALKMP
jgi:glycosyltransferase involved in cell wall biosynthesis